MATSFHSCILLLSSSSVKSLSVPDADDEKLEEVEAVAEEEAEAEEEGGASGFAIVNVGDENVFRTASVKAIRLGWSPENRGRDRSSISL